MDAVVRHLADLLSRSVDRCKGRVLARRVRLCVRHRLTLRLNRASLQTDAYQTSGKGDERPAQSIGGAHAPRRLFMDSGLPVCRALPGEREAKGQMELGFRTTQRTTLGLGLLHEPLAFASVSYFSGSNRTSSSAVLSRLSRKTCRRERRPRSEVNTRLGILLARQATQPHHRIN